MNASELVTEIDAEIDRLMQVRKLLLAGASFRTRGRKRKRGHTLSAEARARISTAQKKRWAQQKRAVKGSRM